MCRTSQDVIGHVGRPQPNPIAFVPQGIHGYDYDYDYDDGDGDKLSICFAIIDLNTDDEEHIQMDVAFSFDFRFALSSFPVRCSLERAPQPALVRWTIKTGRPSSSRTPMSVRPLEWYIIISPYLPYSIRTPTLPPLAI